MEQMLVLVLVEQAVPPASAAEQQHRHSRH
jgi:hypothetical protein